MVRDARKSKAQENAAHGDKNVNQLAVPKPLGGRAYDGAPGSVSDSRGRPPSSSGLPSVGQPRSRSRAASPMSTTFPMIRRDPALEPSRYEQLINTRLDLPGNAYALMRHEKASLMRRPGYNNSPLAKTVPIGINSHKVTKMPTRNIYQYDVSIGNGQEKRGLIQKVWASKAIRAKVGNGCIFNGDKICWSPTDFGPENRLLIDLDAEQGFTPREGHENTHRVIIKKAGQVNLQSITAYLGKQMDFNNHVLMAINFLDHLLRETPSKTNFAIKRSYFNQNQKDRTTLGWGVEAMKGVYQSLRLAEGEKLICNVDVSNSTFWNSNGFLILCSQLTDSGDPTEIPSKMMDDVNPMTKVRKPSKYWVNLKRLAKNEFRADCRARTDAENNKVWKVKSILKETARTYTFTMKEKATGKEYPDTTIEQYFMRRYNFGLTYPSLPLVETTKKGVVFPMEMCYMQPGQRYPYKLDELQTSKMIKFAVTKPEKRAESIKWCKDNMLKWKDDPYLKNYGMEIDYNMMQTNARVLKNPTIQYGGAGNAAVINPGMQGRWNLQGKKFFGANPKPLHSWAVGILPRGGLRAEDAKAFIETFIKVYRGHGGVVTNVNPPTVACPDDPAQAVTTAWKAAGNAVNARPQLLFFVLPSKFAEVYTRIKKSADCRYGVVSQCVQAAHVKKNQPQYHSNVAMKVNSKLGGTTCKVNPTSGSPYFSKPTMVIGADVSHAAPGMDVASMAAMTVSMDKNACRYMAGVQSNSARAEMIAERPIEDILKPLLQEWSMTVGNGACPQHVYYFRDGVSESQYSQVIDVEVARIRAMLMKMSETNRNYKVNFTVIVCEKRHHIRFFPNKGTFAADSNTNPVPGTLVERDVTTPFENDFYLCSHKALQGTARPTHYHVLSDEEGVPVEKLHSMIYEMSYQYARSTTPVSLFPAVYYAHLASNRGRSHEDIAAKDARDREAGKLDISQGSEPPPLLPMPNEGGIKYSMWYI